MHACISDHKLTVRAPTVNDKRRNVEKKESKQFTLESFRNSREREIHMHLSLPAPL